MWMLGAGGPSLIGIMSSYQRIVPVLPSIPSGSSSILAPSMAVVVLRQDLNNSEQVPHSAGCIVQHLHECRQFSCSNIDCYELKGHRVVHFTWFSLGNAQKADFCHGKSKCKLCVVVLWWFFSNVDQWTGELLLAFQTSSEVLAPNVTIFQATQQHKNSMKCILEICISMKVFWHGLFWLVGW